MSETLENLLQETRQFPPPAELAAAANVTAEAYDEAAADRLAFWERQARRLDWAKEWDQVLDWSNPPFAKWFVGGQLNVAYNCLDRHVAAGRGDKVAIHWEGEPGDTRTHHLRRPARERLPGGQRADRPRRHGRRPGRDLHADDPRGGGRDAGLRPHRRHAQRGLRRLLRRRAAPAASRTPTPSWSSPPTAATGAASRRRSSRPSTRRSPSARAIEHVLVVRRTGQDVAWSDGRDVWWHDDGRAAPAPSTRPQAFDAEHPLFILYTSRHDGQAEGHPAHHRRLPDPGVVHPPRGLRPQAGDRRLLVHRRHRLGHRPLATSSTARCPTARPRSCTRARRTPRTGAGSGSSSRSTGSRSSTPRRPRSARSMKWGDDIPAKFDLSSLRLLGIGRRADQPRGVDVVPRAHRRRPLPDRGHLVADRDRRDHDLPAARRDRDQARLGDDARCPASSPTSSTTRARVGARRRRRLPGAARAVAVDAAHDLGRRPAVHRHVLVAASSRACTSPATARRRTTTATSGCSAGSTT